MRIWLRSLEGSLAVRLGLLYLLAMAFAVGALLYQAYETAGSLNDRDLNLRATDLARYVVLGPDHTLRLELPPKLAAAYETGSSDLYAVRSHDGRVIAASPRSFGEVVSDWPAPTDEASYFRLNAFGPEVQDYHGASVSVPSVAGPLSVFVGRLAEGSLLAHSLLREFMVDAAWLIPLFMVITLATGKYAISAGLKPVRQISEMAAAIGPGNTAIRLPEQNLPGELVPLSSRSIMRSTAWRKGLPYSASSRLMRRMNSERHSPSLLRLWTPCPETAASPSSSQMSPA
jgi:hypothetical protein